MSSCVAPAGLEDLRSKYVEMLDMRVAHAEGREGPAVRARMARLATRYPGALREIDRLELAEIRARVDALGRVLQGRDEAQPWMEAVLLFHALARGALSVKRWLAGRKLVDSAAARTFDTEVLGLPFGDDARAWADDLAALATPVRGRLTAAVFERLARNLRVDVPAARGLVFGGSRRPGR